MRPLKPLNGMLLAAGVATCFAFFAPGTSAAEDAARGAGVYKTYGCWTCHGEGGAGDGPAGASLDPKPRKFTEGDFKFGGTDKDIYEVIVNGAAAKGGSPNMVPWGGVITEEADRQALVAFIRSLKK